ncbi:hypothetical protein JCM3765_000801 [Sporobolomyces pararoseus]
MHPPIPLGGTPTIPPRRKRLTILLISLSLLIFHLILSSRLSKFSQSLRNVLDDNDDDDRFSNDRGGDEGGSLGGVLTLIGIARFWSLCSAGIALIGIYAIHRSNLSLLRLFTLNTFLSIALDLFLLLLTLILLSFTSSSSTTNSHSNSSIATTLCQTLSNQNNPDTNQRGWSNTFDWFLPDLLGLSLEQCEEKFDDGIILSQLVGLIAIVEGIRGVCGIKLLGYYTGLAKGLLGARGGYEPIAMQDSHHGSNSNTRRKNPGGAGRSGLRVDTTRLGRMEDEEREGRYLDSPQEEEEESTIVSPSTSNKGKGREREPSKRDNGTRILILPPRSDDQIPSLSLTPSTPNRTSFPPHPPSPLGSASTSASSSTGQSRSHQDSATVDEKRKILVYQPVMMTIEEARKHGAAEVQLSSKHSPRRTRSLSHQQPPPSTSSKSDRRSRSSTITPVNSTSIPVETNKSSRLASSNFVPPRPPPSPSSISTASSSRTVRRQDSDDYQLLTPTKADEVGLAGLLRGDLEIEKERNLQGKKRA